MQSSLRRLFALFAIGGGLVSIPALAVPYGAVVDFSLSPSSIWAYGTAQYAYGSPLNNIDTLFTPFTETDTGCIHAANVDCWHAGDPNGIPIIAKNMNGGTINYGAPGAETVVHPVHLLNLSPTADNLGMISYAIVRWTAPTAGWWNFGGLFQVIDGQQNPDWGPWDGVSIHVLTNSASLLNSTLTGSLGTNEMFNFNHYLGAGEHIYFAVGTNGANVHDSTGFNVQIDEAAIPEPGTIGLFAAGLGLLAIGRLRTRYR
ncbi:MAG: PEP-CTERM sorting domain-containing protein [Bryobacteraceae bacterium]